MLTGHDLTVRAGEATLLAGVSAAVVPGSVLAVVGPNGAGKSTLLHALAGDARPAAGDVLLDGRPLHSWRPEALARVRAVLGQSSALGFAFTALEVVLLGRAPHAGTVSRARDLAIASAALAAAGAATLRARSYPTLSGGEQQRVQLARALAQVWDVGPQAPRYLLLDEPTAALDLAHQHRALLRARDWAQRGAGVLVVLHDLNLAATYADRILVLRAGRSIACGPPAEVLTPAVIETAFEVSAALVASPDGRPLIVAGPSLEPLRRRHCGARA